jgi:membrane protein DedA with SNARE-associated domain
MGDPDLSDRPVPEAPATPPDGSEPAAAQADAAPGAEPSSPGPSGRGDDPPRHLVSLHAWLEAHFSERTRRRLGLVVGFGAAILATLIVLVVKPLGLDIPWAAWIGLFLANWIGNGGILVPIPGLRLVGWTMAVHQGADGPTLIVGLVAGLAMALGQTSFYLTAAAGSDRFSGSGKDRSGRVAAVLRTAKARTEDFVDRHGFPTIFTLSLLPNPLTTFATITAGSMGMGFRTFLVANFAGHVILGLILALFGLWLATG